MKKIHMIMFLLFLNGCSIVSPDTHSNIVKTSGQIEETYWKLVELREKEVVFSENNREPYIILRVEKNRVQGFGGCNLLMGSYELKEGGRIRFSKMASTMMACPQMEEEQTLFRILEEVDHYTIKEGVLSLNKARMAPLARFKAIH